MSVRLRSMLTLALVLGGYVATAEPVVLAPKAVPGAIDRVTVEIELGGKLRARRVAEGQKADAEQFTETPLRVVGQLGYTQRRLEAAGETTLRGLRHYTTTEVAITTGAVRTKPTLNAARALVVCDHANTGIRYWSPAGPLATSELELVDVPGNTLVLDQLLPADAVSPKGKWEHTAGDMLTLLGLNSVSECQASSVLTDVNDRYARAELTANVTGKADGATTKLEVQGIYVIDHTLGRVTQINLAIKELRQIGPVSPGLDGVAKLQIRVEPKAESHELSDEAVAKLPGEPTPALLQVVTVAPELGLQLQHDRSWYCTAKNNKSLTLRKMDELGVVTHCTIARPTAGRLDPQTALDTFRRDVQSTLGKELQQFAGDAQWITPQGYRAVGLVAKGVAADVPVEWHSYLLADDKGERVSISFTLEPGFAERLASADRSLVDAVTITPRTTVAAKPAVAAPAKTQRRRR